MLKNAVALEPITKQRIRELMKERKHTSKELAHLINTSDNTIRSWLSESRTKTISIENISKLASIYHVSRSYLLGYVNEKTAISAKEEMIFPISESQNPDLIYEKVFRELKTTNNWELCHSLYYVLVDAPVEVATPIINLFTNNVALLKQFCPYGKDNNIPSHIIRSVLELQNDDSPEGCSLIIFLEEGQRHEKNKRYKKALRCYLNAIKLATPKYSLQCDNAINHTIGLLTAAEFCQSIPHDNLLELLQKFKQSTYYDYYEETRLEIDAFLKKMAPTKE